MIKKKILTLGLAVAVLGTYVIWGVAGFNKNDSTGYAEKTKVELKDNNTGGEDTTLDIHKLSDSEYEKGAKAIQKLSYKIFRELASRENLKNKNMMISPASIIMAMAMVEEGAENETLSQIEKTFGIEQVKLREWLKEYSQISQSYESSKVNIGNSLWTNKDLKIKWNKEFVKVLEDYYKAQAKNIEFNDAGVDEINKWVKEQTLGMIEKITDQLSPNTAAIIMNAIAFEGKWAEEYTKENIKDNKTFTNAKGKKEKVTMLVSLEDNYFEDKMVRGFKKPYKDGYSFVALQPRKGISITKAAQAMTYTRIKNLLNKKMRGAECTAIIPEFTSKYRTDKLIKVFKKMGIKDLFSPMNADLSSMTEGELINKLFVSDIIHETYIKVDRHGTKAAAVTEIDMKCTAAPVTEYHKVNLNKPFIYAIVDNETNTPLFIGVVSTVSE